MFDWLKRKTACSAEGEMPVIGGCTDLQSLLRKDLLVIFKHSTACPVSWAAHSQVNRFRARHPEVPVHIVNVIKDRPVSLKIAELTSIRHESPQVIIIRDGAVLTSASHGNITEAKLATMVEGVPAPQH